jgi:hypothetical protein
VGERLLILFIGFLDVLFADAQVEEGTDVAQFGPSQPRTDLQRTGGGQAQAGSLTVIPDGRGYAEHSAQHRENVRRSCDMPFGRNRAHPPPHIARGAERTPPHPQIALLSESGQVGRYERIRAVQLYSFTLRAPRPGVVYVWPVSAADTMVRGHPSARLANALCASSFCAPHLAPALPSLPCLLLPCTG